ncbi:hypothetical protein JCM19233_226 [Vibrio astriarenae]|nr:hypothetical protein JCM19233_226 [Vibrio sp. C7]
MVECFIWVKCHGWQEQRAISEKQWDSIAIELLSVLTTRTIKY